MDNEGILILEDILQELQTQTPIMGESYRVLLWIFGAICALAFLKRLHVF